MKKTIFLLMTLCLVACIDSSTQRSSKEAKDSVKVKQPKELSAEQVYAKASDKVAMVLCYKDGIPYSQGSGFFINANTLVTNYHVIEGSTKIELKLTGKEEVFKGAKVIKAAPDYDLAIIQTNKQFPYLPIDSTLSDKVGSKIYTIGNPRGLEGTISEGILSGVRNDEDVDYLQITAPISPGNSGGPVINKMGKVIGVSTFTVRNSQNLNFAMPIKYITKCVDYSPSTMAKAKQVGVNKDAVAMTLYSKEESSFSAYYTLKNQTESTISHIYYVLIYKTLSGEIIDYSEYSFSDEIAPHLAKRLEEINGFSDWYDYSCNGPTQFYNNHHPKFKVEFRLISYEIEE